MGRLCLDGFTVCSQGVLHLAFASRLTGKRCRIAHFAAYLLLLGMIQFRALPLDGFPAIAAELAALYAVLRAGLRLHRPAAGAAALLAVYITQLSFGLVDAVELALFPAHSGGWRLYVLLAECAAAALCACCYALALRLLSLREPAPFIGLLLFPALFFFAAELYILQTAYWQSPAAPARAGAQPALFVLQALGLGALLCTLYAYQRICRAFQTQAAFDSLRQAAQAQRAYVAEAQRRYDRTKAFRHDVKNHLSVVGGLLDSGRTAEAKRYLEKIERASGALSFPCQTGNPVVDILVGEKLGLAEGIRAEVSLALPRPCGIDDFDLCAIFANALDNAVQACRAAGDGAFLRIGGERQGDFLRLEFENTCREGPLPPAGTGLANIRAAAEKYHGAAQWESSGGRFRLHVLLNISRHPDDRS